MGFAPEYVSSVLNENFEDAKRLFLSPLMAIHYAHLVMLAERGIIVAATRTPCARPRRDRRGRDRRAVFDGPYEDLFFYVNKLIEAGAGAERRAACTPRAAATTST